MKLSKTAKMRSKAVKQKEKLKVWLYIVIFMKLLSEDNSNSGTSSSNILSAVLIQNKQFILKIWYDLSFFLVLPSKMFIWIGWIG